MSLKNEHNPMDLNEKIENLDSDYRKVIKIIDMEKANEVSIRNRISEISKSSTKVEKKVRSLKNPGDPPQKRGNQQKIL